MYNHPHWAGFTASRSTVLTGNANLIGEAWLQQKRCQAASVQSSAPPRDKENPKMPQGGIHSGVKKCYRHAVSCKYILLSCALSPALIKPFSMTAALWRTVPLL